MPVSKEVKKSRRQEARVAVQMNGRVTPASGATFVSKGDVRSARFLIECKRTDNTKSISVQVAALEKIEAEALMSSKLPALNVEIGRRSYWVVPDFVWEEITGI